MCNMLSEHQTDRQINTHSMDILLYILFKNGLKITWLMHTHAHNQTTPVPIRVTMKIDGKSLTVIRLVILSYDMAPIS